MCEYFLKLACWYPVLGREDWGKWISGPIPRVGDRVAWEMSIPSDDVVTDVTHWLDDGVVCVEVKIDDSEDIYASAEAEGVSVASEAEFARDCQRKLMVAAGFERTQCLWGFSEAQIKQMAANSCDRPEPSCTQQTRPRE